MLLRALVLFFICSNSPCFAGDSSDTVLDIESGVVFSPEKGVHRCKDEYCCMLVRVAGSCLKTTKTCMCDGCDTILDNILPSRHEDQDERTNCVEFRLKNIGICCVTTGLVGAFISSLVFGFSSFICGCESKPAYYAYSTCKGCGILAGSGTCCTPDSCCPLAYCCEHCFNLKKLDYFSGNGRFRNLQEMTSEEKAK